MKRLYAYVSSRWYGYAIVLIVYSAVILRFVNYDSRWGLAYDQAHDAVIGRYALFEGKIPLVGPFSSAGPFQTGGEWYWLLMALTGVWPYAVITPWIGMTMLYVLFVILMMRVGHVFFGKTGGLLAGLFTSLSTAQIVQGVNLTNQSPLALIGLGAVWSALSYVKTKNLTWAFFLGVFVSLGATTHLQGVGLGALIGMTFLLTLTRDVKWYILTALGLSIPLIPLVVYDMQNDFINSSGFLQYYLHDQYQIPFEVLGRRWLTYATDFWPRNWGYIVGGHPVVGGFLMVVVGFCILLAGFKKQLSKEIILLSGSAGIMATLVRYTRTPLFESYLVFMHPLVLLLTVWASQRIFMRNRTAGTLLIAVIAVLTLRADLRHIVTATNNTAILMEAWKRELQLLYPGQQFSVYDRRFITSSKSMPLVMYLDHEGLFHEDGRTIGVMYATMSGDIHHPVLYEEAMVGELVDLTSSTASELSDAGWVPMGPEDMYNATQHWYGREKTDTP